MKIVLYSTLLLSSTLVCAEQFTCMYPGFGNGELVTLKLDISGNQAISKHSYGDYKYEVLQNTKVGIVLARSFSNYNKYDNRDEVGLFGIAIHRPSLKMIRGNIIFGSTDGAIRQGQCLPN